jgi:hypothetical protein
MVVAKVAGGGNVPSPAKTHATTPRGVPNIQPVAEEDIPF